MKNIWVSLLLISASSFALAKLPPPSDAAKAKGAETAAKAAWQGKVDNYLLCKAQDKVAAKYGKAAPKPVAAAKGAPAQPAPAAAAAPLPPCADPGPFVYTPPGPAPAAAAPAAAAPAAAMAAAPAAAGKPAPAAAVPAKK